MAQAITRSGHEDVEPRRVPMRKYPAEPGNHQGDHHVESPHGAQRQHQAHGEAKQETSHHGGGAQAVMGPHFVEELHAMLALSVGQPITRNVDPLIAARQLELREHDPAARSNTVGELQKKQASVHFVQADQ